MKQYIANNKYPFLLLIIGFFWIVFFNYFLQVLNQEIIYPDANSYVNSSKDLYFFFRGHLTRPIGMAFITGIPLIFGASTSNLFVFGFYINFICWITFLLLLFQILKEKLKPRIAFFFSLISMLFIGNTASIFQVSSESIYLLFIALGLLFFLKYFKTKSFWCLSLALSFVIVSCLIKPGSIVLAIVFTGYFSIKIFNKYKSKAAYLIFGSWLLIVIQCAGLKYQFGNFTTSYIDAITYYCYLGAKSNALETNQDFKKVWLERTNFIYSQNPPTIKLIAKTDAIKQLQTNKVNLVKAYGMNLFENATTGSFPIQDYKNNSNEEYFNVSKKWLFDLSIWQNIAFSILSIFFATYMFFSSYKSETYYSIISFFILATIFLSGLSCSEGDRFNVITFPFTLILIVKFFSDKSIFFRKNYTLL